MLVRFGPWPFVGTGMAEAAGCWQSLRVVAPSPCASLSPRGSWENATEAQGDRAPSRAGTGTGSGSGSGSASGADRASLPPPRAWSRETRVASRRVPRAGVPEGLEKQPARTARAGCTLSIPSTSHPESGALDSGFCHCQSPPARPPCAICTPGPAARETAIATASAVRDSGHQTPDTRHPTRETRD